MRRRDFLRRSAAASAGLLGFGAMGALAPRPLPARPSSALRLLLVHTNDIHSHLDPVTTGRWAGLGGAARRAAMVARLRAEHPHVLLLDAGDIFMGTAYFTLFEGEADLRAMSAAGYEAAAIGNHDFDAGIDRLAELTREHMSFPWLCANYDFSDTPMAGLARDAMVVERDGLRIGVVGLGIKLDGLVAPTMTGATRYLDPVEAARRVARRLRHEEGCSLVVALSHISINGAPDEPGDRDLIRAVPEIDVVIGGHNHILLDAPETFARPSAGAGLSRAGWVNQVGAHGTHLGVLAFDVFDAGKIEAAGAAALGATGE